MPHTPAPRSSRLAVRLAALGALAALTAGCSTSGQDAPAPDGSDPSADAPGGSPAVADDAVLTTKATVREVTGTRLDPEERTILRDRVTAAVDRWFEGAYLGGDYPRTDFTDAFASFTPAARQRATADARLMTNAAVGTTTYAVRPTARSVVIDVLSVDGRASGVTARFRLGMARSGETGAERRERVTGRLFLTYTAGPGWQVFGYDVQRGAV